MLDEDGSDDCVNRQARKRYFFAYLMNINKPEGTTPGCELFISGMKLNSSANSESLAF